MCQDLVRLGSFAGGGGLGLGYSMQASLPLLSCSHEETPPTCSLMYDAPCSTAYPTHPLHSTQPPGSSSSPWRGQVHNGHLGQLALPRLCVNWVYHLKKTGCSAFVVGAMDDKLLAWLQENGIPTFLMNSGLPTSDFGCGKQVLLQDGELLLAGVVWHCKGSACSR